MSNSILQSFLDKGLFSIDDDQSRFDDIVASSQELVTIYAADKKKLISHTLVALDPNIPENDPVILEVEDVVKKRWKTLRSKFIDMPRTLLRGVILGALYESSKDSIHARIIYLTSSNFYPYINKGREAEIWYKLVRETGEIAEKEAISEWQISTEEVKFKIPKLKFSSLQFASAAIDGSSITKQLTDVNARHGVYVPNNYNATGLNLVNWRTEFTNEIGLSVGTAVTKALLNFGTSLKPSSIEDPLNKFIEEFKTSLESALKDTLKTAHLLDQRSKLLWWKESLYSLSLKKGYREINSPILPLILAADLIDLVPLITPLSVDYFLKDVLLTLNDDCNKETTLKEVILNVPNSDFDLLLTHFNIQTLGDGRITLTDFISLYLHGKVTIDNLTLRTGFDADTRITLSDIAVMLFHDLLTKKIVA